MAAVEQADLALFLLDGSAPLSKEDPQLSDLLREKQLPMLVISNKLDRPQQQGEIPKDLSLSAKTGEGVEGLLSAIYQKAIKEQSLMEGVVITNARQRSALLRASQALEDCAQALESGLPVDMAGIDLKEAWDALGEITGTTLSEKIVDEIFESFCLGK